MFKTLESLIDSVARYVEDGKVSPRDGVLLRDEIELVRGEMQTLKDEAVRYQKLAKLADNSSGGTTIGLAIGNGATPGTFNVVLTAADSEIESDTSVADSLRAGMESAFLLCAAAGLEDGDLLAKNVELIQVIEAIKKAVESVTPQTP